jgi:drug/metabolite transporter (DMT)-like permease
VNETSETQSFGVTDLLLVLMAVIWGVNFSVAKYGTQQMDPQVFVTLRVTLAAIVLSALTFSRERPDLDRRTWIALLLLGVVGHGVYQYLFVTGLALTRVGNAAVIVGAAPAFIAIASRLRGLERARATTLGGIALSVAGVAFVIIGSSNAQSGRSTMLGSLLVFGGVICWSFYSVGLQPYTKTVGVMQISAISLLGGVVPLLIATSPALMRQQWSAITAAGWAAVLYSGVVSMVIAYLFWYRGLRVLGATRTSVYGNLHPIVAIFIAWIFLHEAPTVWQGIGMATIVGGIFLTRT